MPRRVFKSDEYVLLSVTARSLLDELQSLHMPGRNGRIVFSNDNAKKRLRKSESTITKAYKELQDKGFIILCEDYNYVAGKAREWRLTYEPYRGREPTDDWMLVENILDPLEIRGAPHKK